MIGNKMSSENMEQALGGLLSTTITQETDQKKQSRNSKKEK